MDLGASLIAILTGVLVKGVVMILGGVLLARLYRASRGATETKKLWLLLPREDLPDVRILWWSLVLFAVSEVTCGIEIYVISHSSATLSGFHAVSSAAGMALFTLGIGRFLDRRLFRYGTPACTVKRICHRCTIQAPEGCKFQGVLVLVAGFVALAAILPLFAPADRMNADVSKYALPFPTINAWYDGNVVPWCEQHVPGYQRTGIAYYVPATELFIEFRLIPLASLTLALAAVYLGVRRRETKAFDFLCLATGSLAYSYMEVVLLAATGDPILGALGHEVAEFWFLLATAEFLRRTFPATPEAPQLPQDATTAASASGSNT